MRRLYEKAVGRFLESEGADIKVVGVLVRDTSPSESDLMASGQTLSGQLLHPTQVVLLAWYLPIPLVDWPKVAQEQSA